MATLNAGRNAGLYSESMGIRDTNSPYSGYKPTVSANVFDRSNQTAAGKYRGGSYTKTNPITDNGKSVSTLYEDNLASNTNEAEAARYDELAARLEEVKSEISNLEREIARQEQLKALEVSKDPYWELAKEKYIKTGDMTELNNIMNRKMTKDTLATQTKAASDEKKAAQDEVIDRAMQKYRYAKSQLEKNDSADNRRIMNDADIDLKWALKKAGRESEYETLVGASNEPAGSVRAPAPEAKPENTDNIQNQVNRENELKAVLADANISAANLQAKGSELISNWNDEGTQSKEAAELELKRKVKEKYDAEIKAYNAKKKAYDANQAAIKKANELVKEFNESSKTQKAEFFNDNTEASKYIKKEGGKAVSIIKPMTAPVKPKKPEGVE